MIVNAYLAEFIGTALLVLFGNGVVANVLLARTKGNNAGWIVISAGWGLAVFIGAFCSAHTYSGAHLNPAVTVAMAMAWQAAEWRKVGGYIVAQNARRRSSGSPCSYLHLLPRALQGLDGQGRRRKARLLLHRASAIRNNGAGVLLRRSIGTFLH